MTDAFTTPARVDPGLYVSNPQGHARLSDGRRELCVLDMHGVIDVAGVLVRDPEVLDGLSAHLAMLARRLRDRSERSDHPDRIAEWMSRGDMGDPGVVGRQSGE